MADWTTVTFEDRHWDAPPAGRRARLIFALDNETGLVLLGSTEYDAESGRETAKYATEPLPLGRLLKWLGIETPAQIAGALADYPPPL